VRDDVSINSETLLVTDFVNLKIKLTQSFKCAHKDRMCVHIFIRMSTRTCINIYVCTVILKKAASFIMMLAFQGVPIGPNQWCHGHLRGPKQSKIFNLIPGAYFPFH
jgi:hypothetical protein